MKKIIDFFQRFTFPTIIALSALSVSASAAFYSVTGLSKLFAGASFEVMIMAASLEFAKLVVATLLYQYWKELNKLLKVYLSIAAFVLVIITSAGIYGFLSSAYQETATKSEIVDKEISILELKKKRFEENRTYYISEKTKLDESINQLRGGLSNNVVQYRDKETGQILTTQSSGNRKTLETQLKTAVQTRDEVGLKLESMTDSITNIDLKVLDIESNSDLAGELGPLKYLSELTKVPMNKIVNYLLLVIVFVFDPLAISLVIAANFAFKMARNRKDDVVIEETTEKTVEVILEPINEVYEFEEFRQTTPTPIFDMEEIGMKQQETLDGEELDILSKEAGKLEQRVESERFIPTEDFLKRLEDELIKIQEKKKTQQENNVDKPEKTITLRKKPSEDDDSNETLLDVIESLENEEIGIFEEKDEDLGQDTLYEEEKQKTPNEDKRRLTYQKKDGGRNVTVSRF